MSKREFGILKTYDVFKGYGFIRREKGKDVFLFFKDFNGNDLEIVEGCVVSFEVEETGKGPKAINCKIESDLLVK